MSPPPVPRRFEVRTTVGVVVVFLLTMAIFLVSAYRAERSRYASEVYQHLEETIDVLPELSGSLPETARELRGLEDRLAGSTGVVHRILVVGPELDILAAARSEEVGEDLETAYGVSPMAAGQSDRATAARDGEQWFAVSRAAGEAGERVVLLRSRRRELGFLRSFLVLHGLHIGVTVLLFVGLLSFFGARFIRRPILQLADYVRQVEAGKLRTRPSPARDDEFGWLADRFAEMGERLEVTVRQLVRQEKASSAVAVAYRVVRQLGAPLARLQRHTVLLESTVSDDAELATIAADIERDRGELVEALLRLEELVPDEKTGDGTEAEGQMTSGEESE